MKQSVLGGLTVAVALSIFGAPSPSYAQATDARLLSSGVGIDTQGPVIEPPEANLATSSSPPSPSSDNTSVSSASPPQPEQNDSEIATVFPHALDANQAATIYIHSIPVMTLIGGELATLGGSKATEASSTPSNSDPVLRANTVVARLLELSASADPNDIAARWDAEQQAYVVSWNQEDLVTVNSQTILPDTTQDPAEDTLHMANRLRRLLGDAPALSRVDGMPEPTPATNRVGLVSSTLTGMASWYGPGFHGRRSASGEVFNQNALTAAHRTLPFGTQVRVTNLTTGQQVTVRINDRGPFSHGRIIDLSAAAAANIGLRASGVGRVQIEVLDLP